MLRPLYHHLAYRLESLANCRARPGDLHFSTWTERHTRELNALVREYMPSGAGVDNGVTLDLEASTSERIVLHTAFHHMNDGGMYDGWTDHTVTVRASLSHRLDIRVGGRNRNDVKDHLHDLFGTALLADVDDAFLYADAA